MKNIVVITGAGRGLGFALAKRHLMMGDEVFAFEMNLSDELLILQKYNDRLAVYPCDIRSTESVNTATAELLAAARPIARLYNAAAIRLKDAFGGTLPQSDLDAGLSMLDCNAVGLLRVCKALYPLFDARSLIISITGEQGSIGSCRATGDYLYAMSKAAANMASKLLSNELYAIGARVLCYHPGVMRTALGGTAAMQDPASLSPEDSAAALVTLLDENRPPDQLFIGHKGQLIPW